MNRGTPTKEMTNMQWYAKLTIICMYNPLRLIGLFTLLAEEWSAQSTTGEAPPKMSGHTFIKINHSKALVFGGESGRCRISDTYLLNMKTWVCYTQTILSIIYFADQHKPMKMWSGTITEKPIIL